VVRAIVGDDSVQGFRELEQREGKGTFVGVQANRMAD
jgi:hypothetical protein